MAESTILGYKSLYTVYKRGVKLSGKKSYTDCNLKEIGIIPFKFRIHGIHGYGDLSYALEVRLEDDGFIKDFVPWSDLYRCIEFVS